MSRSNPRSRTGDTRKTDRRIEEVAVADEGSVSERRTLQRIQTLWDEVADIRMATARAALTGETTPQQRRTAYYNAVRNLWIELKPHLAAADKVAEEEYLLNVDLGTVILPPPEPIQPSEGGLYGDSLELLAGESWPNPVKHNIEGFVSFEEVDPVLAASWSVRLDVETFTTSNYREELIRRIQRTEGQGQETAVHVFEREGRDFEEPFVVQRTKLLPEHVIETAFQALVELTHDLGLSAELGFEDTGDAGFTYDQLLQEGPPE